MLVSSGWKTSSGYSNIEKKYNHFLSVRAEVMNMCFLNCNNNDLMIIIYSRVSNCYIFFGTENT